MVRRYGSGPMHAVMYKLGINPQLLYIRPRKSIEHLSKTAVLCSLFVNPKRITYFIRVIIGTVFQIIDNCTIVYRRTENVSQFDSKKALRKQKRLLDVLCFTTEKEEGGSRRTHLYETAMP